MSDAIRLAGICCVTVALCVAILAVPEVPLIWGPLIGIFAALLGVPLAVRAIRKKLGLQVGKGMEFTWYEWHATVSGWGDGVALSKAEKIPKIEEIPENPKDSDFYAIIAMEAWYYKVGVALGRLTWALIIGSVLIRLIEAL